GTGCFSRTRSRSGSGQRLILLGNNAIIELKLRLQSGLQNSTFGAELVLISKANCISSKENMKALLYQQILRQRLPPTSAPDCPRKKRKQWYFGQDNDPKHKSKKSMELIRELTESRFYKHPPLSPDFNVWSYSDREVRKSRVTSIRGLKCKLT